MVIVLPWSATEPRLVCTVPELVTGGLPVAGPGELNEKKLMLVNGTVLGPSPYTGCPSST